MAIWVDGIFFAKTIESRGYGYERLTKESWGCFWPTIVDMDFKFYPRINHYKLVLTTIN